MPEEKEPVPEQQEKLEKKVLKAKEPRSKKFVSWIIAPFERRAFKDLNDYYLESGEHVVDYVPETVIPSIDFRWVILTDRRIIFATRYLMTTDFQDMNLDQMEFEYKKGPLFFDQLAFERYSISYTAQFYSYDREHVVRLMSEIEEVQKEHLEPTEEISQKAIQALHDLAELYEKGLISKEDYEKKKQKYLEEI